MARPSLLDHYDDHRGTLRRSLRNMRGRGMTLLEIQAALAQRTHTCKRTRCTTTISVDPSTVHRWLRRIDQEDAG